MSEEDEQKAIWDIFQCVDAFKDGDGFSVEFADIPALDILKKVIEVARREENEACVALAEEFMEKERALAVQWSVEKPNLSSLASKRALAYRALRDVIRARIKDA